MKNETLSTSSLVFFQNPSSLENDTTPRCLSSSPKPFEEEFINEYNTIVEESSDQVLEASEISQYKTQAKKKDVLSNIFITSSFISIAVAVLLTIVFLLTMLVPPLLGSVCMFFMAHRFFKWGKEEGDKEESLTSLAEKRKPASSLSKEKLLLSIHALLSNTTPSQPCKDVLRAIFRKVYDHPSNQGFVDDVLGLLKDLKKGFELEKVNQDIECL